jgi:hypothetical protein
LCRDDRPRGAGGEHQKKRKQVAHGN